MIKERILEVFQRPVRAVFLSFFGGVMSAFAMAPYNFWPLLIAGFAILYLALHASQSKKQAFSRGWAFGFGYFTFGLYWIGNALLVEGNPYLWAWPLAVCGLPALLAVYSGFAGLVVHKICDLRRWQGYIGFCAVILLFEWLRGHLFTGFPWNTYGYTWESILEVAQIISLHDVYLLTWLTVFWLGFAGFLLLCDIRSHKFILMALIVVSFAENYVFGKMRMDSDISYRDDVVIKVVQPNTPQHEKWQRDKMRGHFKTAISLSGVTPDDRDTQKTLIVWPETVLNPQFLESPYVRNAISRLLSGYSGDAVLLTGALRYQEKEKTYHNSLISIDKNEMIGNIYDKSHLVPFGEYIPFQKWIPLKPVVQFTGFAAGDGPEVFSLFDGGLTYSPLICYETIFPHFLQRKKNTPDAIVNVTNDAWYGFSPGPFQHLAQAKFRAIESGTPFVRAANTGISTVIDPYGRTAQGKSQLFQTDKVISPLPTKIVSIQKNLIFIHLRLFCFIFVSVLISFLCIRKHGTK